ncbi:MAG TPA: toll/interleukin-1 receptor domain-containing protein [Thermoanaerobaculia bacterium]|nr:toll/interleukin-1 receptor domain-containing protein [Thermoanaerobaculia bacterium]
MPADFDVFLSHNSRDNPQVEEIGNRLRARGLRVWLDKEELQPGFPWQEGLEKAIQASRAVAVFVGAEGLGAWQEPEMRAFIAKSRREKVPVIPVLLPGCPDSPQLNLFLEAYTWVDLREGLTEEALARLAWGITGTKPAGTPAARNWRTWGVPLALLLAALALGVWLWRRPPAKPEMYEVRVQVLDPQGQPVDGSKIRASAGNEPHLLPDGWWEIQIPAAKVPADGHVTLWAEHKEWQGNSADLPLGADRNPRVTIRLKPPETSIGGWVVDGQNKGLAGIRVSPQDGGEGTITGPDGRFDLKLSAPRGNRVGLRVERKGSVPQDVFCYAGTTNFSITLGER